MQKRVLAHGWGIAWDAQHNHISVDIAAGGNGIQLDFVKCLDRRFYMRFIQSMQLQGLACRDFDDAGRMFTRYMVCSDPLFGA